MTIRNKKILIIIGGGIAAYKSLDLIRLLRKSNNEIKTILTKSGKEFVTPLSISTLTKSKTFEDIFDKDNETISKECIQMVRDKIGPVAAFKVAIFLQGFQKQDLEK